MTEKGTNGLFLRASLAVLLLASFNPVSAQAPASTEARLREIFEARVFDARSFPATWHPDGTGYVTLEGQPGTTARELVKHDAVTGRRAVLASLSRLVPPGGREPLAIQSYSFSPDGRWILLRSQGNGFWMLEEGSKALRRIEAGATNRISPEGERILFGDGGDLHVYDLGMAEVTRLTWDGGNGSISNGRAVWSPDGQRIAFVQTDASRVRRRTMLVPTDPSYPDVREVRFARVGETIASLRVGVVHADGSELRWVSIPSPREGFYLGQVSWAGNSHELLVEQFSRFRDERHFFMANVVTGEVSRIYHESDPAWVIASYRVNAGLEWIRDGTQFLVLSEKAGWRHAWMVSRDGAEERLLTTGEMDIMERAVVDEERGWFYFIASPDDATQRYLYRIRLDGRGSPERVTPADQPGTHFYDFSPGADWAIHTYSTFDTPPVTELVKLPEHRAVRVLEDNAELRSRAAATISHPTEFFQLDVGGVEMDVWMIKPRNFDPSLKYPVFIYVYGEPHGQTVLDRWSVRNNYHRAIADLGYLVVSIENRGTPAPKGAAWRRAVFGSLGPLNTEDHAAAVLEMGRVLPFVDLSRVGIWGWSGGGSNTLNALFRRPDVYHVGIAVAPKPQPHLYNAWFQEIYMETRETNPEGYRLSAPINFAEGLEGDLLIVHGTGETNTHLEITEGLVDRLVELGKQFDYMTYPNRDHGLSEGPGTPLHLRMLMVRYLLEHLPPGGR